MELGSVTRRSSCLRFQLFGVETFSFLPKCQSDGRNLARQGQTRHRRLHSFGQQSLDRNRWNGPAAQLARVAAPLNRSLSDHGCGSCSDRESVGVSSERCSCPRQSGIRHCRGSQCPAHCRSTVAACCGNDAGSASAPSSRAARIGPMQGIWRSSFAAYVSGSPPTARVALAPQGLQ